MFHNFLVDLADKLSGPPSGGKEQMWIMGVLVAAVPTVYGLYCCVKGHAKTLNTTIRGFPQIRGGVLLDVHGAAAFSLGMAFIFVGMFCHFQWFWCHHDRLNRFFELGKVASLIGLAISVGFHIYYMLG